jgi:hypothetical protein
VNGCWDGWEKFGGIATTRGALTSPRDVRNALVYVLMNIKKHTPSLCDGVESLLLRAVVRRLAARAGAGTQPRSAPGPCAPDVAGFAGWRTAGVDRPAGVFRAGGENVKGRSQPGDRSRSG